MYALQQSYKRKKELFLKLYFYEFFEFDSKIRNIDKNFGVYGFKLTNNESIKTFNVRRNRI